MNRLTKEVWEPLVARSRELAAQAALAGDIPVGALVVRPSQKYQHVAIPQIPLEGWEILAEGFNRREVAPYDPTAHAEVVAIRAAAEHLGRWRLDDCTLVVSLEPCMMCAGAIVAARLGRLVFGAWDAKAGGCGSVEDLVRHPALNHQVEVYAGVDCSPCAEQLHDFFNQRRLL